VQASPAWQSPSPHLLASPGPSSPFSHMEQSPIPYMQAGSSFRQRSLSTEYAGTFASSLAQRFMGGSGDLSTHDSRDLSKQDSGALTPHFELDSSAFGSYLSQHHTTPGQHHRAPKHPHTVPPCLGTGSDPSPSSLTSGSGSWSSPSTPGLGVSFSAHVAADFALDEAVVVHTKGGDCLGRVRFQGLTNFAKGELLGIALDEPRGINDGSNGDVRYFQCPHNHGLFTRPCNVKKRGTTAEGAGTRHASGARWSSPRVYDSSLQRGALSPSTGGAPHAAYPTYPHPSPNGNLHVHPFNPSAYQEPVKSGRFRVDFINRMPWFHSKA
jgi:hypothetical protein